MEQPAIVQIAVGSDGTINGLGSDNKVYRWNKSSGDWAANWSDTDPNRERGAILD